MKDPIETYRSNLDGNILNMTVGLLKDNRRKSRFKLLGERSNGFVATYSPMSRKKFIIGRLSRSLLCKDGPKSFASEGHLGPMGPRSDVSWVIAVVGNWGKEFYALK